MRVLVTGASGFVGSALTPALTSAGYDVRALVRNPADYELPINVDVSTGDLLETGSFEDALDGVDVAYYLVHSMHAGPDYAERDQRAARNFRAAAEAAGVERVVYLGGLGTDSETRSTHLRSRHEVERILDGGEYDLTTLRAAIIVGTGSASFQLIRELAGRFPFLLTPPSVSTPCHPIAIDDVVDYLVSVLDIPETANETYEIGGPEVLSYADIIRRTSLRMGRTEPRIVSIPLLTPERSSYWVGLLTDVPRNVARPLVQGLRTPVVADDDRLRELVSVDLTPFDAAVEQALDPSSRRQVRATATDGGNKR